MSEWEPATDAEVAMRDALRTDDQEAYFRILAGVDLLLPVSADALAGLAPLGWGTWSTGGRTHVLAFTSPSALQACLADYTGSARRVPYAELADTWPNLEWWLAVNPGLPIEGYLPAWFVAQLARGDLRLPKRPVRETGKSGQDLQAVAMAANGAADGEPGGPMPPAGVSAAAARGASRPGGATYPPGQDYRHGRASEAGGYDTGRSGSEYGVSASDPSAVRAAGSGSDADAGRPASGQVGPGGLPLRTPGAVLPSGLPSRVPPSGRQGGEDSYGGSSGFTPPYEADASGGGSEGQGGPAAYRTVPARPGGQSTPPSGGQWGSPGGQAATPGRQVPPGAGPESPGSGAQRGAPDRPAGATGVGPSVPFDHGRPDDSGREEAEARPESGRDALEIRRTSQNDLAPDNRQGSSTGQPGLTGRLNRPADGDQPGGGEQSAGGGEQSAGGGEQPAGGGGQSAGGGPPAADDQSTGGARPGPGQVAAHSGPGGPGAAQTGLGSGQAAAQTPSGTGQQVPQPSSGGPLPRRQAGPPSDRPASMDAAAQAPARNRTPTRPHESPPPPAQPSASPDDPGPTPPIIPGSGGTDRPDGPPFVAAPSIRPEVPPTSGARDDVAYTSGIRDDSEQMSGVRDDSGHASAVRGDSESASGPQDGREHASAPLDDSSHTGAQAADSLPTSASSGDTADEPDFVPANAVERDLLDAADGGSTDAFLSTLLLATVLVPVADSSRPGSSPGESGFAFRTEELDGERFLVVFTSRDRLAEHYAEPTRTVGAKFLELIRNWPDPAWWFAVNPSTPIGAKYPGPQVIALANWAAEAGLGAEPEERDERPAPLLKRVSDAAQHATIMQKTVPAEQVDYYLERGYDRVAGFVHRANEVEHLRTPAALFAALGLVHDGSPFTADAKEAFVLRWPAYRPSLYRIPYGGQSEPALRAMDGWVIERPPFRGNGFAPGEGRDVIAEFKVDSVRLPHGAQLWRVDADGTERMIAIFDCDAPIWRKVGEQ